MKNKQIFYGVVGVLLVLLLLVVLSSIRSCSKEENSLIETEENTEVYVELETEEEYEKANLSEEEELYVLESLTYLLGGVNCPYSLEESEWGIYRMGENIIVKLSTSKEDLWILGSLEDEFFSPISVQKENFTVEDDTYFGSLGFLVKNLEASMPTWDVDWDFIHSQEAGLGVVEDNNDESETLVEDIPIDESTYGVDLP